MSTMNKAISVAIVLALLAALAPVSLADSGGINPYKGLIGADSPFYKAKIFAQKLDTALTFDPTSKMKKQMQYADERVSEMLAAEEENNTAAMDDAADEYSSLMEDLNETTQVPEIDDTEYARLEPMLVHHKECFYTMMNNSTNATMAVQGRLMTAYNQTIKMKNGMPFYYYNGTAYFIPPGQMKKMNSDSSYMPPGLAKKGYGKAVPTIVNGSPVWPWDQVQYDYNATTKTNGNGHGNGIGHNQ